MTEKETLQLRDLAEAGQVQFKERITNKEDKYDIGCEMVAFSNSRGGRLVIGINDKSGEINALSYMELQETTNLLTSIASENVIPNVLIDVENVPTTGGAVVVATIPEGKNKPYHDNKGIIWVKNGADKRKVFDNSELADMMGDCGRYYADEEAVRDASIEDLDADTIKLYMMERFSPVFRGKNIDELTMKDYSLDQMAGFVIKGATIERLLRNLRFIRPDGQMTKAAMMLFGKYTQRWLPEITAKCICFFGNSVGGTQFRDKMHDMEIEGNLLHQYRTIMNFFTRNLRKVQVKREFNSLGEMEIPYESLTEYVVNALVHRSLNIKTPIRIFIFDDRVEIHSPGSLPNGLTIEDVKNGTSMPRNVFLFTNANYLLPYTGAGSGLRRALEYDPDAVFSNGVSDKEITHASNEFVITIPRKSNQVTDQSNLVTDQASSKSEQVTDQPHRKSDQVPDPVISKTDPAYFEADPPIDPVPSKSDLPTDPVRLKLSKKQQDIRNFCSVPRSRKEILERAGVSAHFDNRKKYIYDLVEAGVLEPTIPEKPNDPNQKYRRKK
ncbi:AAA family ATPase [Muribaculaceae bacterium Isolate-083 (Janvier)]|nr:AAA family ATPase [Muribaculaceae bacterium Isolate-077 (Janvier)]ROS97316.1 AAA family ATPase [Muribaculaceae bacterium Isolate-083 (Janvier)]ROS97440.1 AAA family ATPase [Muribaculaceae bacterium Isolate-084 (Janvier)]